MLDINIALAWYTARVGGVYYSMTYRNGQMINANGALVASGGRPGFDCSSAGYYALKAGGFFPAYTPIGNTDSIFNDFEKNGWTKLQPNAQGNFDTQKGDSVVWGRRGASSGGFGHYMMFLNSNDVIHCNAYYNDIHINNYDGLWEANEEPEATFYRYTGAPYTPPSIQGSPTDQVLEIGSTIKFSDIYTVDELAEIGDLWQVRNDKLCPVNFTWDDNGLPAAPLYEVDGDGYKTSDQDLSDGTRRFIIPGKYQVLDLFEGTSSWFALIKLDGYNVWVDVSTATEIASADTGTAIPGDRPSAEQPPSSTPPATPTQPDPEGAAPSNPVEQIPNPPTNTPPASQPNTNNTNQQSEEQKMAFSTADQKKLKVQTQDMQTLADSIAISSEVEQLVNGVSKKVKLIVYIVGDALVLLGLLTPNIAVVAGWNNLQAIVALSSAFGSAGAFVLTMFGIYKNGKN